MNRLDESLKHLAQSYYSLKDLMDSVTGDVRKAEAALQENVPFEVGAWWPPGANDWSLAFVKHRGERKKRLVYWYQGMEDAARPLIEAPFKTRQQLASALPGFLEYVCRLSQPAPPPEVQ